MRQVFYLHFSHSYPVFPVVSCPLRVNTPAEFYCCLHICVFAPGTSHSPKTCMLRLIGDSKYSLL